MTVRQRAVWQRRADGRHAWHVQCMAQTPLVRFCRFVVQQAVQQVVQQIEPMEFEPIQPTTFADTRRGAVYSAMVD